MEAMRGRFWSRSGPRCVTGDLGQSRISLGDHGNFVAGVSMYCNLTVVPASSSPSPSSDRPRPAFPSVIRSSAEAATLQRETWGPCRRISCVPRLTIASQSGGSAMWA